MNRNCIVSKKSIIANKSTKSIISSKLFAELNQNYSETKNSVEKNWFEIFDFWSNFDLFSKVVSKCNSLFKLKVSRENLVLLKGR